MAISERSGWKVSRRAEQSAERQKRNIFRNFPLLVLSGGMLKIGTLIPRVWSMRFCPVVNLGVCYIVEANLTANHPLFCKKGNSDEIAEIG